LVVVGDVVVVVDCRSDVAGELVVARRCVVVVVVVVVVEVVVVDCAYRSTTCRLNMIIIGTDTETAGK